MRKLAAAIARSVELRILRRLQARDAARQEAWASRHAARVEAAPKPESSASVELNQHSARTWPHPKEAYGDVRLAKIVFRFEAVCLLPDNPTPCDVKDMGQRLQLAMGKEPGHVVNYMTHTPGHPGKSPAGAVEEGDCGCAEKRKAATRRQR